MNRTHAFLLLFAGTIFGSLMTYAVASFVIGEDVIGQSERVKESDQFLDSVSKTVRAQRGKGLETQSIDFSCTDLGCLLSQGEMSRAGMNAQSICLWRQVDPNGRGPLLSATTGPHFLDLTADVTVRPESVLCRDVTGQAYFGQL
jgi:hypothetical protein